MLDSNHHHPQVTSPSPNYGALLVLCKVSAYLFVCLSRYVDYLPAWSMQEDTELGVARGTCVVNDNVLLLSCAGMAKHTVTEMAHSVPTH